MIKNVSLTFTFLQSGVKNLTKMAALLFAVSSSIYADDHQIGIGELIIENTFTFATPPGAMAAGGYLTITNHGSEDDTLIGGTASFAEVTQVHEMKMTGGVMKMSHLEQGLTIPAGESVTLQPGGLHMMFMQLTQQLQEGEVMAGSLVFSNAGEVPVEFTVMNRSKHMSNHQEKMQHDTDHAKSTESDK